MTARECAIDLIKPYIKRGDDPDELRRSYLGASLQEYSASIAGYVNGKKYDGNHIIVYRLGKKKIDQIFKYKDIVKDILTETKTEQLQLL